MSPVKKRIKENKDHYFVSDTYQPHHHRSPLQDPYRRHSSIHRSGAPITIHDTPPMAHAFEQHPSQPSNQPQCSKTIPEVITISDSDDDGEQNQISKNVKKTHNTNRGTSTATVSSSAATTKQSTPNINGTVGGCSSTTGVRNISSGCPSVMPITPLLSLARERGQEECYTVQGASSQSTPNCTSRSGVPSCVTVNGDSDEDFQAQQHISSQQRTPIKQVSCYQ